MATDMTVSNTILDQLGGQRFKLMVGAKDFMGSANSLTFGLCAITKNRTNKVRITLTGDDTYTIETMRYRNLKLTPVEKRETIFVENLRDTFTDMTGLRVSL